VSEASIAERRAQFRAVEPDGITELPEAEADARRVARHRPHGAMGALVAEIDQLRAKVEKLTPEHAVTAHWDAAGGDVLYRSCLCGEEWARDEERCPLDDDEPTIHVEPPAPLDLSADPKREKARAQLAEMLAGIDGVAPAFAEHIADRLQEQLWKGSR
jgi:hypothetical protein